MFIMVGLVRMYWKILTSCAGVCATGNILTELDRDMLIENENSPYGRISSNIVKKTFVS